jgi:transcriptional regulator of heat shock response
MSQSSNQSHKSIVEQFADAVSNRQVNKLDNFLEADVQKTTNSKVVYKNIQEAQDYYSKENTSQWKILEIVQDDAKGNTMQTRVSHDNKIYKTSYTFGPSGKIHRIETVPEN